MNTIWEYLMTLFCVVLIVVLWISVIQDEAKENIKYDNMSKEQQCIYRYSDVRFQMIPWDCIKYLLK